MNILKLGSLKYYLESELEKLHIFIMKFKSFFPTIVAVGSNSTRPTANRVVKL